MSVDKMDDTPARFDGTSQSPTQGMGTSGFGQQAGGRTNPPQPIKQQAGQLMDEAQNKVGETINVAQQEAKSMLGSQKGRAAESLGGIAQALRQTGQQMQDGQQAAVAQYAQRAADKIEQFSSQLQNKDVDQLLADVEGFARRRPEVFLGGALLLGFAAARFLKSSAPTPDMQMQMQRDGMQRGYEMNRPRSRSYQTGNL